MIGKRSRPVATVVEDAAHLRHQPIRFTPLLDRVVGSPHYFLSHRELKRPKVGIALSGGGARALAQIGVLQALEENNIQIEFIAGTSMGSIIGGLYAAGYTASQLHDIVAGINWKELMTDEPSRRNLFLAQKQEHDLVALVLRFKGLKPQIPRALTAGQKLHSVLTDLALKATYWASDSFDKLRIPFRAIATDVYSGREVILDRGDLAEAMRASSAFPLFLSPVPRDGMLLVDGGLVNNIPVDVVRAHGKEVVIAVDATSNLRQKYDLAAPWDFADQVTTIMQQERNKQQRQAADVLISLKDLNHSSQDFSNIDSLISIGYRLTVEKMDVIRARYASSNGLESNAKEVQYVVRHVRILGERHAPAPVETGLKNNEAEKILSPAEIQGWVNDLYASGNYSSVQASLSGDTLRFDVKENPRIAGIRFIGNTVYSDSVLFSLMGSKPGQVINHRQSKEDLTALVEKYRQDGYALAEIRQVDFDPHSGVLTIKIDEGIVAAIQVEGLERTKEFVVLREFSMKTGEIFNSRKARQGIDNIHSTGLFENVSLNLDRRGDGSARVKIKVEEKPSKILRLWAQYESERGSQGFVEFGDENAFGTASKVFLHSNLGGRDQVARLSWRSDRIFRTYLTFSASIYHELRDNFTYRDGRPIGEFTERRAGLRLLLGQHVRRFGAVSAELRREEVRLRGLSGTGYPTDSWGLNAIKLESVADTRDEVPFARAGRYFSAFYEYVKPTGGLRKSFIRFFSELETYHSAGPHTIRARIVGGTSDQTTPFSEQFRVDGPHLVYGLRNQELVGRHMVVGSLEYRYQLRKRPLFDAYLSIRYDLSGVWIDRRDVSYRKFNHALGLSITWDTPLGPIGAALGFFGPQQRRMYFNFGKQF